MYAELPLWPPRRRRRQTDMLWLDRLEEVGLAPFQDAFPDSPPAPLDKAVEQFNTGLFWDCHETLEDLWLVTPYPLRHFYQGVLKIAVGFHHSNRHNVRGCRNKLGEGLRLLKVFTPSFLGLDTGALAVETDRWLQMVSRGPRLDWTALDSEPKPWIRQFPDELG